MNLVDRVKAILLQPKSEWNVIDGESGDAGGQKAQTSSLQ